MRKTKIVCTIGPSCSDEKTLTEMCNAGMNVARLNFSHGTHSEHQEKINLIKTVRSKLNLPIAIMLDTKGPEYRIKTFKNGKIFLNNGDTFTFTTDEIIGDNSIVAVSYKNLPNDLTVGDTILLNNGLLSFEVNEIKKNKIITKVLIGGELTDRKSMSFPNKILNHEYLGEQDKKDILFGIENKVDYIACSFVSTKNDLIDIRNFLKSHNCFDIDLIAKIENQAGVDNIDEILEECSGIMIGRGDMGVEIPFEELPAIQKKIITKCRLLGKRVITATEMLESMIEKPRPTRAEISDVANAVYDGTSAIMLSGETAAGKYPVKCVETMSRIAEYTEKNIHYSKRFKLTEFKIKNTIDAISHATCGMAIDINAKAIAVCTISGITARMISRFRPPVDILGMTTDKRTWYKLALSWGVTPLLFEHFGSIEFTFNTAKQKCIDKFNLNRNEKIVVIGGMTNKISGNTNLIKIETV